jgi:hypothetical protein
MSLKEWVDLFYGSNEGTYMVQGANGLEGQAFTYATDPEIIIRRIAGRLGFDPQDKRIRRIILAVHKEHMQIVNENMREYFESRKPENENRFLRNLPKIPPPSP